MSDNSQGPSAANLAFEARRRRLRIVLLSLGPIAVLGIALAVWSMSGRYAATENAYVKADMVALSGELSGQIAEVFVVENEVVAQGQPLWRLDDRPYRMALARADANLRRMQGEVGALGAELRRNEEELRLAEITADFAAKQLQRQSELLQKAIVAQSKFDEAKHASDVARRRIDVLRQEQARLQATMGGAAASNPGLMEAQAERRLAALDLERALVRAPIAGIVTHAPQPGDYVKAGTPVMSIVAGESMWIEANFKETELTHVAPGQRVRVTIDTYPGRRWEGEVASIAPATGAEFAVLPAQNATGNWTKIVQRIPVRIALRTDNDSPPLRVGMSAWVEIDTGRETPAGRVLAALWPWGSATSAAEIAREP